MKNMLDNFPEKLTRVTTSGRFIKEIDGLRFLAIFPVVIQHLSERIQRKSEILFIDRGEYYDYIGWMASRGFIGVYLFFAISGFVLSLPFAAHYLKGSSKVNIKNYFLRRVTRLEPPYIFFMTLFFIVLLFSQRFGSFELFLHYLASLFYIHNLIYGSWTPINPVAWTLEIEIQFYIIAPFLATFIFQLKNKLVRRIGLLLLIYAGILLQYQFGWIYGPVKLTLLRNIQYFLLGFLITDFYLTDWKIFKLRGYLWDIIFFVSVYYLMTHWSLDFIDNLINPLVLFVVFISVFHGKIINYAITNKWITATGGMCYTIYLIHLPLAELYTELFAGYGISNHFWINLIMHSLFFVPIVFLFSAVFFLMIEKPCMDKNWHQKVFKSIRIRFFGQQPV